MSQELLELLKKIKVKTKITKRQKLQKAIKIE